MAGSHQDDASPPRSDPPAADGRSTRWDAHRARRREQLIDAALAVLEEDGPDFGLQQVAARAGVTKPVIYRHFGERAALVEAMGDRATNVLMARLMPAVYGDSALLVRMRASIDAFLGFLDESPNIYWLFARRAPMDERDVLGVDKEFVADALAAVLGEHLRALDIAGDQIAAVWARGTVGFVQNAAEWWLQSRAMSRDELADHLTTLLWAQVDGLARRHGVVLDPDVPVTVETIANSLGRVDRSGRRPAAKIRSPR